MMKKALQIGMLLFAFQLAAQVPNQFNYQAVLRDNLGAPLATQNVSVRIGIYSGAGAALKLFEEEHSLTTSDRGLIDLRVGGGNVGFGTFAAIDWTNNQYYMKVEVNTGGGFIDLGTQQLVSVPFAIAAKKATDMEMSNITNVSSTPPNAGQILKWNGSIWEPSDDLQGTGGGGATYTPGAGISISGANVLSISNNGVSTAMLANNAVTNAKLANNAVQSSNIQNGAVSADKLAQMGAINGEVLKWNGTAWAPAADLTGGGGGGGAPTGPAGGDLSGTYPNPSVANSAINTVKIANNAVNNQKIANGAVSGDKLNQMSATTGQVLTWTGSTWEPTTIGTGGAPSGPAGGDLTGTYPNPTIANNAVNTAKISNNAVTSAKIASSAVTANELANNAVTTAKIQNAAVTMDKLAQAGATNGQAIIWNGTAWVPTTIGGGGAPTGPAGGDLSGTYPSPTVSNNAINTAKISNNAVTSAKIANGAVTMTKIDQAGATNGQVIAWNGTTWAPAAAGGNSTPTGPAGGDLTGTYPNPTISNNAIITAKVSNSAITDAKLANNAVSNAKIAGSAVTGDKIAQMSATNGQVLTWTGTTWAPTTVGGGGAPSGPAGGDLTGTYPNPSVANTAITTAKIANNAVTSAKIATNAVTNNELATDAVQTVNIQNNAVTSAKIATNAVTNAELASNAVATANIQNSAVTGAKIAQAGASNGQVLTWTGTTWAPTTVGGGGGAPTGPAGGDLTGTYPNPSIALDAIGTNNLINGSVTNSKLANNSVGTNQLNNTSVTEAKLANNSVTTAKVANSAITGDKIAQAGASNGQVLTWTGATWAPTTVGGGGAPSGPAGGDLTGTYPDPTVANSAINTVKIANNAVTTIKISNNAVTADKIATNAVTNDKIASSAVSNGKIENDAITSIKILNGAVTMNKIAQAGATNGQVIAWNGTAWAPTTVGGGGAPSGPAGGDLAGTYPNPTVASNAITTAKIANNAITSAKIATNAVTNVELATNAVATINIQNQAVTGDKLATMGASTSDLLTFNGGSWGPISRSAISPWNVKPNGDIDFPNGRVFIGASWGGLPQNFNLAVIDTTPTYIVVGGTQVNTGVNGGLALTEGFNSIGSCGFDFVVDGSAFGNTGLFLVAGCPDKNDTVFEVTRGGFTTWRDVLRVDINQGPDNKFANNNVDADLQVNMRIFVNTTTTSVNRRKGIAIRHRANSTRQWNIATRDNSNLEFFHDGTLRGTFSSTNGVYTSSSDRKLKTDIIEMPSVLTQVKALDAYTYRFIWQTEEEQQRSLGFMAQDVRKFFPELVYEATFDDGEESWLQMDYAGMSVIAIKAIQEQQEIIEAQQQRIEALENTIVMFSQRLDNIEKQNATITAEK